MEKFSYKTKKQLRQMDIADVRKYFRELRKYEYEHQTPFSHVRLKDMLHPLIHIGLKIDRFLSRRKLEVLNNYMIQNEKPHIFAVTHVGRYDIESALEAVRKHAYLFYGDREETYRNWEGIIIDLNGAVSFDTGYFVGKDGGVHFDPACIEDRKIALKRAIALLSIGQNLILYPEGAWNLSPNLLTLPLYAGFIDMNFSSNADIIPVAIERFGKRYAVIIGRNIDFKEMTCDDLQECYMSDILGSITANSAKQASAQAIDPSVHRDQMIRYLRDALATLKWLILEKEPLSQRESLPDNYERLYIDEIMAESEPWYTEQIIRNTTHCRQIKC